MPLMKERYPGTMGRTQGEMKETIPAMNAVNRETDSCMAVDRSSGSGERWRNIGRRSLLITALTLGILASASAQTAIDPGLTEAMKTFETALKQKDIEKSLSVFRFANAEERSNQEAELRGIFSAREI